MTATLITPTCAKVTRPSHLLPLVYKGALSQMECH